MPTTHRMHFEISFCTYIYTGNLIWPAINLSNMLIIISRGKIVFFHSNFIEVQMVGSQLHRLLLLVPIDILHWPAVFYFYRLYYLSGSTTIS